MTNKDTELLPCGECGMLCEIGEYHPYAACLMFKGCENAQTVRSNLNAVSIRPNTPQSSEVDYDTLKRSVNAEVKKVLLSDVRILSTSVSDIVMDILNENGYLKTPAENVRCDGCTGYNLGSFENPIQIDWITAQIENVISRGDTFKEQSKIDLQAVVNHLKAKRHHIPTPPQKGQGNDSSD